MKDLLPSSLRFQRQNYFHLVSLILYPTVRNEITHRQQRNLVVKIHEAFYDYPAGTCASAHLAFRPSMVNDG